MLEYFLLMIELMVERESFGLTDDAMGEILRGGVVLFEWISIGLIVETLLSLIEHLLLLPATHHLPSISTLTTLVQFRNVVIALA
jgi:hypothetical protein